jgi:hypothetical protein
MDKTGAESELQEDAALNDQRASFSRYVSSCQFFGNDGMLDLEAFCMHFYLSLYCDGVPRPPQPVDLYVLMLNVLASAKPKIKPDYICKVRLDQPPQLQSRYYPDGEMTRVHFKALAVVYARWIRRVGEELLAIANPPPRQKGRFWVQPEWKLTSAFLNRFEAQLVQVAGLSRILFDGDSHKH